MLQADGGREKTPAGMGLAAVFSCDALAEINELARQFANEAADPMLLPCA